MRQRKLMCIAGVVVLSLLSMEFACQNGYAKAGQLAKDFAASVLVAQQVEIQAHIAGYVDDTTHAAIQAELLQVADAGMALDKAINQAHSVSGARAQIAVITQLLTDLSNNKLAGIKNEQTKTNLKSAILVCQTIIDSILAFGA